MSFSQDVYWLVKKIPCGKVVTYGQIAAKLGKPKAARTVGNALHKNPDPDNVPCHRVVNREGRVAMNFGNGGWRVQRRRLLNEGVTFIDKLHIDVKKHRYRYGPIGQDRYRLR